MSEQHSGGCLCGNLRYQFSADAVISAHHCHCRDCQKSTGSGKATIVLLPTEALKIDGAMRVFTVTGSAGSHVTRGFCGDCGSPVISYVEEDPSMRFVKAGSLDDSSWLTIDSSFWSETATHWSGVTDEAPSFPGNPLTPL
ncbi:MAG: GFA family protein [Pseudomonadaceae bacterium]|nr:GFA family protein [Pseudomonadaceae bacterium]